MTVWHQRWCLPAICMDLEQSRCLQCCCIAWMSTRSARRKDTVQGPMALLTAALPPSLQGHAQLLGTSTALPISSPGKRGKSALILGHLKQAQACSAQGCSACVVLVSNTHRMMKVAVIPETEEFWTLLGAKVSAAMKASRLACAGFITDLFIARHACHSLGQLSDAMNRMRSPGPQLQVLALAL